MDSLGSPIPSLEGQHVPAACRTPSPQQQLAEEVPLAQQSCPLFQKEVTPELAQPDSGSRLIQCWAKSEEDMETCPALSSLPIK